MFSNSYKIKILKYFKYVKIRVFKRKIIMYLLKINFIKNFLWLGKCLYIMGKEIIRI